MISAKIDLELMKMAVEELKTLKEKARLQKMDVSSVAVANRFTHEEWVSWMEWQPVTRTTRKKPRGCLWILFFGKAKGKGKGNKKDRLAWIERRVLSWLWGRRGHSS